MSKPTDLSRGWVEPMANHGLSMNPAAAAPWFWDLVCERARLTPNHPLLADNLGRQLTASEFANRAEEVAAGLLTAGVTPGSHMSWQLPTCLEAVVLMAALSRLQVIQNPVITALRQQEWRVILEQVSPDLVVLPGVWKGLDYRAMLAELAPTTLQIECDHRRAAADHSIALPVGNPADLPPINLTNDLVPPIRWTFFSSGTTAAPKGVTHTDASVIAGCNGMVAGLSVDDADIYPIAFPIPHIGGAVMVALALRTGCQLILFDEFDSAETPRQMAAQSPTLLGSALPFHLAYLNAQSDDPDMPMFPTLKACTSGGAAKPQGLHTRVRDALGGRGVVSSWGLTEIPLATHGSLSDSDEDLDESEGRASPGVEVIVVDANGDRCGPNTIGELHVTGPQLFTGYLGDAAAEAFDSDGYFCTGDLGLIRPSGHVVIVGRLKDVIVRNAENVSAKQVEDVLVQHPAIGDAAVFGVPHPKTGERICAAITVSADHDAPDLAQLSEHCRTIGLARFKTPEDLLVLTALPRNSMGKVLTNELRALHDLGDTSKGHEPG